MPHALRRSFPRRFVALVLGSLALILGGPACAGSLEYGASPQSFASRYPTYYSTYGCNACHTTAPTMNATYGTAYRTAILALGRTQGNVPTALANIEPADSDGDGYTNLSEINANRKAYDATDHQTASVSFSASPTSKNGTPGTTVPYSVTVTNNGNAIDSFTLGVSVTSGQGTWTPSVVGSANNVSAGGTASITVNVAVPGGATAGQFSVATLTAVSQANSGVSATPLNLTTNVVTTGPRYVNQALGNNTGTCTSSISPCRTITYAMTQASSGSPGDAINVAAGTYSVALGEVFPIAMKSGVQLLGAGSATTIVDATGANQRIFTSNAGNSSTLIQGFTLTGGLNLPATDGSLSRGGAIFLSGGDQTRIRRNLFSGNEARGYTGGGVSFVNGGHGYGGAIFALSSSPVIENNVFRANIARGGRGKDYFGLTTPANNGGQGQAGAVWSEGGTVTNNTFHGNQAIGGDGGSSQGPGGSGANGSFGAVHTNGANVVNNIFAGNAALGGAAGNGSPPGSAGSANYGALEYDNADAFNNLFFGNTPSSGDTVGNNFINNQDPQFVSPPSNLHIALTSPAHGTGTATGAPAIDHDGVTRPNPPSIGAYEPAVPDMPGTDLNGDGKADILWRNPTTGQVYRMLMNGLTISGQAMAYQEPNTAWKVVADGDFNGDGITDLLWRNTTTGQVFVMPFASNGLPNGGAVVYTEPNAAWKIVHTPDLDGDGKADLLWWNSGTGQVYAMLMNGTAIATQGMVFQEPNTAWQIVGVGDLAGSGKRNQLVWRNNSTAQIYLMTVNVSGGVFSQSGQMIYQATPPYRLVAVADLNGDGKSDLLFRNDNTGQVYLILMNGASIISEGVIYTEANQQWKIVASGDFNDDGKSDILWRNDTTGQVYMMLMNGAVIASQALIYQEPNTAWKILGPYEYSQ